MRTCPKVRGIAAHCTTREHKSTFSSFHIYTYNFENTVALNHSPRLFLLESQSKQQHDFVTGKVTVCDPACLKPSS